jgi:hypothetical protein
MVQDFNPMRLYPAALGTSLFSSLFEQSNRLPADTQHLAGRSAPLETAAQPSPPTVPAPTGRLLLEPVSAAQPDAVGG